MKISALQAPPCSLGEGPLWDAGNRTIYWVDSLAPRIYRQCEDSTACEAFDLPGQTIGSLALREQGGLLLAMDQGVYLYDPARDLLETIELPLEGRKGQRLNDGKVDPFGNFVFGAMNVDPDGNQDCAMYRLDANFDLVEILDGFRCFNGPCFSADGSRLYVTGRQWDVIEAFDYGPGALPGNGRPLISDCNPDGATVDAEDHVWSAQWDDACLLRIAPDGGIDARLKIPGQVVSSVMFGGAGLDRIFVTTLGRPYYGAEPGSADAGRTLVIDGSGHRGCPQPRFRG
jgi:sugar lactone lactonase YvrE